MTETDTTAKKRIYTLVYGTYFLMYCFSRLFQHINFACILITYLPFTLFKQVLVRQQKIMRCHSISVIPLNAGIQIIL